MAERLARHAFDEAFGSAAAGVIVSSAGTHAYAGSPMHSGSAAVLAEGGINTAGFSSRAVNSSILMGADLVLAAGRDQRAACVTLAPATVRRTFTLRQFTRLAAAASVSGGSTTVAGRLHELVDGVSGVRNLVPVVAAKMDDLPDPVNRPVEAFRDCAEEIWRSLRTIVGVIAAT